MSARVGLDEAPASRVAPKLDELLRRLVELQASDLHLKPMRPPHVRLNGELKPIEDVRLEPDQIVQMLTPLVPERLRGQLERERAAEFGYGVPGVSRFRASVFYQRGTLAAVFRRVAFDFPTLEEWGLPAVLSELCRVPQGLVLITGPTGSGKSSTLAAIMRQIAESLPYHIVTIEDPIEFLITDEVASVSQREVGTDTPGFSVALRNALRQDPDVIMVGEMRDEETIRTVLTAAETGHLVFSTLHTNDAVQTVDRIINSFPKGGHDQLRQQLATVLEAVVSLQLVPRADGDGMVAAVEILRRTPQVSKLIERGDIESLREEIQNSVAYHKMQSMNQSLAALVIHGSVTHETAMSISANPSELDLMLRKTVGAVAGESHEQGGGMAECTSDFSKILELQEIRKLYEDLQERHGRELQARDREIAELRQRLARSEGRPEETSRLAELQADNARLAERLASQESEYEGKLEKFQARLRELKTKAAETEPRAEASKRGFFRR